MPDIGSKVTHVIQANSNGEWKNVTKHEGIADAKAHMENYIPKKKQDNYRIRTLAQAGLTRNVDQAPAASKAKPAAKKAAPVAKKAAPVVKKAAPAPKKAAPVAKKAASKKAK
jgi:hypothetical protein